MDGGEEDEEGEDGDVHCSVSESAAVAAWAVAVPAPTPAPSHAPAASALVPAVITTAAVARAQTRLDAISGSKGWTARGAVNFVTPDGTTLFSTDEVVEFIRSGGGSGSGSGGSGRAVGGKDGAEGAAAAAAAAAYAAPDAYFAQVPTAFQQDGAEEGEAEEERDDEDEGRRDVISVSENGVVKANYLAAAAAAATAHPPSTDSQEPAAPAPLQGRAMALVVNRKRSPDDEPEQSSLKRKRGMQHGPRATKPSRSGKRKDTQQAVIRDRALAARAKEVKAAFRLAAAA
jgi:hypothetical protein